MTKVSVWGHGQLLAFSGIDGPTDFDGGICLRTRADQSAGAATIVDVKQPGAAALRLGEERPTACDLSADFFELQFGERRVRGVLLDAWHLLMEGDVRVTCADGKIAVRQENGRTLVAPAQRLRPELIRADMDAAIAARRRWTEDASARNAITRPAAIKALRQLKGQVYSPEGVFKHRYTTPDRWPHRGCWLWDSAFHAIGARHVDAALARDAISAVFDGQQGDGRVPIRMDPNGRCHPEYTQPPTLTLATWLVMQNSPDMAWLRGLLPKLRAYLLWDVAHRDAGNGLPYWAIEGEKNCRSGESGLDNSSRFDAATRMEAVDFASFLALEFELLGHLYEQTGDVDAARECRGQHARLCALIRDRLWDAPRGIFMDYDVEQKMFCPVVACTGFLPLICGAATREQAALLAKHLDDPQAFGTRVLLPSVARNDASYDTDMWRGPVWVNMVWLVAAGFERYGMQPLADRLRRNIVGEIERWHASHGTMFEYFDADGVMAPDRLKRKGRLAPEVSFYHQCFHDYGWTGTLYLDMLLNKSRLLPAL